MPSIVCRPGPSQPLPGGPHLGIWAVRLARWRKLPYAMLAAATELPGAVVHVSGADDRVVEFVRELQIFAEVSKAAVPQHELPRRMAKMHLNLYVTFSECCPMVPMESLAEGVPCLLGPNSHLFEDDAVLAQPVGCAVSRSPRSDRAIHSRRAGGAGRNRGRVPALAAGLRSAEQAISGGVPGRGCRGLPGPRGVRRPLVGSVSADLHPQLQVSASAEADPTSCIHRTR